MSESETKQKILDLVATLIQERETNTKWTPGVDWVKYAGPVFDENEYVKAIDTLLSGWIIFGENGRKFEDVFPDHLGKEHGVLTNSGSSANLLMIAALMSERAPENVRLRKGDKIITPVTCFPTTINPLIQHGLVPIFVDVEIPSLNLDLDEVEAILKAEGDIRGITFAHVLGNPPDMNRLMALVEKYNLVFIEDACDALGSFYDGEKLGSFGVVSSCSFFPAHHMTLGEGGFVATDDYKLRKIITSCRDWGRACFCNEKKPGDVTCETACGNRFRNWLPGRADITYDHRYVFDEIGYNLKPIDLQASIGLEQVKKLPMLDEARRVNFKKLDKIFSNYNEYLCTPIATDKADPCWFGYLMIVKGDAPFKKSELVNFLESKNIQTRSYFTGNALYHPAYQKLAAGYDDVQARFPNADIATRGAIFLGTFAGLTDKKINYIGDCVDEFMRAYAA